MTGPAATPDQLARQRAETEARVKESVARLEAMRLGLSPEDAARLMTRVWREDAPKTLAEAPARCRPRGAWHYRLFCDARGRAVAAQDAVFTGEAAGGDWRPFRQAHPLREARHAA